MIHVGCGLTMAALILSAVVLGKLLCQAFIVQAMHCEQGLNATRRVRNSNLSAHGFADVNGQFRPAPVLAGEHLQQIARDGSLFCQAANGVGRHSPRAFRLTIQWPVSSVIVSAIIDL